MNLHKLLSVFMTCAIIGTAIPVSQATIPYTASAATEEYTEGTYGVLTYKNYGDQIEISDCNETAVEVVIPEEIDGLPVTAIGTHAFDECYIESITIPDSVTSIYSSAFAHCESLINIIIPDGVTRIGDHAFYGCTALTSVNIPASVTTVGSHAFYCCYGLEEIVVHSDNSEYSSTDGVLFNKDQTNLLHYPCQKSGAYTIPESVTLIQDYAFYCCDYLTDITIPDGVTWIGEYAFAWCSSLTSVTVPDTVENIGSWAFAGCYDLKEITILSTYCEIYDASATISNNYSNENGGYHFTATIYGYEGSTTQEYAEKYGYTFAALDEPAAETAFGIATFIGILGMDSCWGYEDVNSLSKAANITGDAQYEVIWDVSESGGATDALMFLAVEIDPVAGIESFTTDDFPDLEVTIDEVWIDNTLVENYSTSENAVNTQYYEVDGVTRLYLHDDWTGTDVADLPDDTTIVDNIRVKFTVSGLGTEGISNVSPDPEPEITTTTTTTTTTTATTSTTTTTTTTTTAPSSEFMIIPSTLKMSPGDTSTLLVIYAPDDSTVQWTSDNTDIVTILNGVAIAVNTGTATIYAVCGNSVATCKVIVSASGITYGDADCDGKVGITDVVKIMTHLTTPGGTLSDEGINNADVYQRGDGIGNMDALAVQKKIAQLITELPESYM